MASYASVGDLLEIVAPGVTPADLDSAWGAESGGLDQRLNAVAGLGLGWAGALEWAELSGAASRYALSRSGTAIAVHQAALDHDAFGLSTLIPIAYTAPFVVGAASLLAPAAAAGITEEVALGATALEESPGMFDWISNAWDTVTNYFNPAADAGIDLGGMADLVEGDFALTGLPDAGYDLGSGLVDLPDVGGISDILPDDWMRIPGSLGIPEGIGGLPPGMVGASGSGAMLSRMIAGAAPTAGRIGGTMAAGVGAMTLAGIFGAARAGGSFIINGIRGTIPQLWKYTRKYGPTAVANGLGITVGALGTMLLQNPERRTHRRRGISSRDIRTTKRVVRFVSRMAHDIGCVRAPRHFTKRRH